MRIKDGQPHTATTRITRVLLCSNLTFTHGNASGLDPSGGGAIFVRGGRFKALDSKFFNNRCDEEGPDVGGAAIYNDGNTFHLKLCGTTIHDNTANEGGTAIFFVSNDRTGTLRIENSAL